ncbi:DUF4258 domain-containing protein [Streptomyces sp. JNUCC 63]
MSPAQFAYRFRCAVHGDACDHDPKRRHIFKPDRPEPAAMTDEELLTLRITPHFLDVIARRDISPAEVADCLRRPDIVEPHDGRRRFVRGRIAVVVAADGALVTALLRDRAHWTDADARNRNGRR